MRLTARFVQHAPIGWHCDGRGLYLQCTASTDGLINRSWVYRYAMDSRERYMGLGPVADVSLAEARDKALAARKLKLEGIDPLQHKQQQAQARKIEQARTVTFRDCAEQYLDLHLENFKNPKHRAQWRSTLATYVYPKIGNMSVADIGPADVLRCIEPIWNTKRETASRVRQRIERILDYATTRQYRTGDNPAAHVTESLPKTKNGRGHFAALPYVELPTFMQELRERDSLSARALEFTILTAARTGEVIGATRDEINIKTRIWTVPAGRMKAGKEHRVPLSSRAIEILQGLDQRTKNLFPLSNMGMAELLKGMRAGVTVHGMRSSFMDWAHECTNYPKVVIDKALTHAVSDKVEAAYRRGDLFVKRTKLMNAWADFCGKPNVVSTKTSFTLNLSRSACRKPCAWMAVAPPNSTGD
jgi:integrase